MIVVGRRTFDAQRFEQHALVLVHELIALREQFP